MRKKIVAGNWKMNGNLSSSNALYAAIVEAKASFPENVEVMVAPSFVFIPELMAKKESRVKVIAQNCASNDEGAFTGEVSASMLKSIGVDTAIVGHSERRHIFGESIRDVSEKVVMLLKHNMQVVFCVGEQLNERKSDSHFTVISDQLASIQNIDPVLFEKVIVAYEPVWAIGTGETASPQQAQEMHAFIREELRKSYGNMANETRILYGGSVKPANAKELFSQSDVDGGLVGGASLNADDFIQIILAAD